MPLEVMRDRIATPEQKETAKDLRASLKIIEMARAQTVAREATLEFPHVYPNEAAAADEILKEINSAIKNVSQRSEDWKRKAGYGLYLTKMVGSFIKGGVKGVSGFVYENLEDLVTNLTSGKIEDFDTYRDCEYGDSALALLGKTVYPLGIQKKMFPNIKREIFLPTDRDGKEQKENFKEGAVLFVCGYGATLEPYKKIFKHIKKPIIAYQMPHGVVNENPAVVGTAFREVHDALSQEPYLDKVTHLVGNSIGTMFTIKKAIDMLDRDSKRVLNVALVQTGTGWAGAVERSTALFGRQLRERAKKQGWKMSDFAAVTHGFNPEDLIDKIAAHLDSGRLKLSLFQGMGDKAISPAREVFNPMRKKLDATKAKGKYKACVSEIAGHNAAMLLFLWAAFQGTTEWSELMNTASDGNPQRKEAIFKKYWNRGIEEMT